MTEGWLPPTLSAREFSVGIMAPEAVAAVHGTSTRGHQQGSPLILVQKAGHRRATGLGQRIGGIARGVAQFLSQREDLTQKRIPEVAAAHLGYKAARHQQPEVSRGCPCRRQVFRRQGEHAPQLVDITDCVTQQRLPAGFRRLGTSLGEVGR